MKIVFIAPFGLRPKGTVAARMVPLAVGLQGLGHQVTLVAPPYTNPEDSGKVEFVDGITIRNIKLGPLAGSMASPFLAGRLFSMTLGERPDRVHLFKPKGYGGLAALFYFCGQRAGRRLPPLYIDTDDWEGRGGMNEIQPYSSMEKRFFHFQEKWLPPRAHGVTVASRTLETRMWGMGLAPEKVLYIPNGVKDTPLGDGSAVRLRWNISPTAPVLLLYTRFFEFDPEKLLYVFSKILQKVPDVQFLVVGKGRKNEEERLMAAAKRRESFHALRIAGWVEPEAIPHYLAAGDVAIFPLADTLFNRAKCPAKLTELLMAERAVVADRVGQAGEYIIPGVSGVLCDPANWNEMADRASELLLNTGLRRVLGAAARRHLLEKFSWSDLAAKLERFYLNQHQGV